MKVAVFSTKPYDEEFLNASNTTAGLEFAYYEERLNDHTSIFARGYPAVCGFVNDVFNAEVLQQLHDGGVRTIALRCAGFNQVDLRKAHELGIKVTHVPAYSPYAVAEFALSLILTLNRRIHRAYNRIRSGNFTIDGLLGFDLHGKTVGVVGTGKIGCVFANLFQGFGVKVLGYDPYHTPTFTEAGGTYVDLPELLAQSDIISLHCPLTPETFHLVNDESIAQMKPGVMLINTSRGALVNAKAVIRGLKSRHIGYLGLDVYEQEAEIFYENFSEQVIMDDVLQRLITFPNVLVTSHQAYFTDTALQNIADTTIGNLVAFQKHHHLKNEVTVDMLH